MTRAELNAGRPASESQALPIMQEAASRPGIERIGGVRILRGGAGWHGISLRVGSGEPESCPFDLSLVTEAGHSVRIACLDEDQVVAAWRGLARDTGLPMLVEKADGTIEAPYPQLGHLALGPVKIRRAHGALRHRRPRFLSRRKTARLADLPVIHAAAPSFDLADRP
jgi:Family of unknown function (DUF6101)